MTIKLLGFGSSDYGVLEENTKKAIEELGIVAAIENIEDFTTIHGDGTFKTIGLVINGRIKAAGKVSTVQEIKNYILAGEGYNE
jgi:hypothetical protein